LEVDVLIVGAGPAGSTTARYCAGEDLEVLVIDRRKEIGYPVQCGELLPGVREMYSIFPKGLNLEELFTLDSRLELWENDHVDLISPGGRNYRIEFKSFGLDRRVFDKHLAKLAVEAGARLQTDTSLLRINGGIARTTMGDIKAKVIVGADGPTSRTAREAGMSPPSSPYPAVTCKAQGDFGRDVRMYFGSIAPRGYAWIIPKKSGANIGVGFRAQSTDKRPSELFSEFISKLGCKYSEVSMGLVPVSGPARATVRGNVLLVGDAAGHVMATNGGGIPTAMIAGRIAGEVIKAHSKGNARLEEYDARWRGVMEGPLKTSVRTRKLADAAFAWDPLLGLAMFVLGRRGLDRAIRCKRVFV
jgi:digeranylgeranylglycerophospholipid reductase